MSTDQLTELLPGRFSHPSGQQFVQIAGGWLLMGITADAMAHVLETIGHNPNIDSWTRLHAQSYARARPVRAVWVAPFLCGVAPITLRVASQLTGNAPCSRHLICGEAPGDRALAAFSAQEAVRICKDAGWSLLSEAQWEHAAGDGGKAAWVTGPALDPHLAVQELHLSAGSWRPGSRETKAATTPNGLWGLAAGEWVADAWHDNYSGAPDTDAPWTDQDAPGMIRGGGAAHYPWQDTDEAISTHVAHRGNGPGEGSWAVRPIIRLPDVGPVGAPPVVPPDVPFADTHDLWRGRFIEKRQASAAASADFERKRAQAKAALAHSSVVDGVVRSVGANGVVIVRMAAANGMLAPSATTVALAPGDRVRVRVIGSGGVPAIELIPGDVN